MLKEKTKTGKLITKRKVSVAVQKYVDISLKYEKLKKQMKWTSAKTKPKRDFIVDTNIPKSSMSDWVLTLSQYGEMSVGFYSYNSKKWQLDYRGYSEGLGKVMYWINLPQLPKNFKKQKNGKKGTK